MKLPRVGLPRLGMRIYAVSVGAVLAAMLGLLVALRLAWDPRRDPGLRFAAYPARQLALRWPSAPALAEELRAIGEQAGQRGAVFRWDGSLIAFEGPATRPLDPDELQQLAQQGTLARHCPGEDRVCDTAFVLGPGAAPGGYAVLGPGHPPPPPFREFVPLALTLVGLGVAAALLSRSIVRPLQQLSRAARALGHGDLSARTGLSRPDELGEVARAFDEMAGRVEGLLRSQTELIANVAHELRTPLARIRVALDLAADGEGDAEVARSSLAEIAEDLGELERLVEDVLASSRMDLAANTASGAQPTLHTAPVELAGLLRGSAERLGHRFPGRTVEVVVNGALPLVNGDAVLLRRAVDNLLDNARKYSPPSAPIALRATARGGAVVVVVKDGGDGIAPEDLARLFTPFFRADPSRARKTGGVGLGLTLSRRIVEAHGGTLVAESVVGEGTTLTITLPALALAL